MTPSLIFAMNRGKTTTTKKALMEKKKKSVHCLLLPLLNNAIGDTDAKFQPT